MKAKLIIIGLIMVALLTAAMPTHAEAQSEDAAYYTWEHIDQFIDWYHAQNFKVLYVRGHWANCLDYALLVQREAMKQGRMVSVALNGGAGTYYDQPVSIPYHAGNLVITPDATYWVEPQPDKFRVVRLSGIVR